LFFAYGHFTQMPALGTMFDNADYRVLNKLQAGGISYGVLGNPDVKPEHTVQYQFGYKQAVTDWLGLDASVFYKDIRDLLGVEFITTYNGAEYARLTNVDFGNVIGVTVALDQRQLGRISTTMDYTWEFAQGNSSDPRETATRASAGEDPRPRVAPLNWDQRHTFNLTANVIWPVDSRRARCCAWRAASRTRRRSPLDSRAGSRPTPAASLPRCCSTCGPSGRCGCRLSTSRRSRGCSMYSTPASSTGSSSTAPGARITRVPRQRTSSP
jgi:hypothetical protein